MRRKALGFSVLTSLVVLLLAALPSQSAVAQTPADTLCNVRSSGLVRTMKTFLDLKLPRDVALEESGLRKGGPRYQIAAAAYTQLAGGMAVNEASQRALSMCMRLGADAVEDDEPTFNTQREDGGGAQLCGDLASTVGGFLTEDPGAASLSLDKALERFRASDPREMAAPRERAALETGLRIARVRLNAQAISSAVYAYCEKLTPQARAELDEEFYVP